MSKNLNRLFEVYPGKRLYLTKGVVFQPATQKEADRLASNLNRIFLSSISDLAGNFRKICKELQELRQARGIDRLQFIYHENQTSFIHQAITNAVVVTSSQAGIYYNKVTYAFTACRNYIEAISFTEPHLAKVARKYSGEIGSSYFAFLEAISSGKYRHYQLSKINQHERKALQTVLVHQEKTEPALLAVSVSPKPRLGRSKGKGGATIKVAYSKRV